MRASDFLFHIDDESNSVYFNPKSVWITEKVCADHYTDEESEFIEDCAKDLGLIGVSESCYEPSRGGKIKAFRARLADMGFETNRKFSSFMKSCLGEVTEDELMEGDDYDDEPEELNF